MRRLLCFALMTLSLAGCATARAAAPLETVRLEVPPVPPRVIVPDIEEVALSPEPGDVVRPAAQRPDAQARPPEKPADPPKPVEEAPRVRTPQMANNEEADRVVRAIMARAQGLLGGVDYRALSPAARQQYDIARRFITQADNALKIRNYVFARNLAD
ncbi:MAG TPA: hypothetical protein VMN81_03110, partial [Vicinamibacterales bacterium]|nr:hypothetical protein [Vicinamibacterales bacterium]